MDRRHRIVALVLAGLLLLAAAALWWRPAPGVTPPPAARLPSPVTVAPRPPPPPGGQPAWHPPDPADLVTDLPPPLLAALGSPGSRPADEARVVLSVFDAYRRTCGGYPCGASNRQFVNALLGANPAHLPFVPADHPRLTAQGELVDAWGTPFSFHLLSQAQVEIRSAGPDRRLYSADDLVASSPGPRPPGT